MTDHEFLAAFENCSLPEKQWTHRAHVRMAWLNLRRSPLVQAIDTVRTGIQRFNTSLNKPLGYHETITIAFLYLISHRMQRAESDESFDDFCGRNTDLVDQSTNILLAHYRKETLFSPLARQTFVEPDLLPLPRGS